jgi:hypothetical protein
VLPGPEPREGPGRYVCLFTRGTYTYMQGTSEFLAQRGYQRPPDSWLAPRHAVMSDLGWIRLQGFMSLRKTGVVTRHSFGV